MYEGKTEDTFDWENVWLGSPLLTAPSTFCLSFTAVVQQPFSIWLRYIQASVTMTTPVMTEQESLSSDWVDFYMDITPPPGVDAYHLLFRVRTKSTAISAALDNLQITSGSCHDRGMSTFYGIFYINCTQSIFLFNAYLQRTALN